MFTCFKLNLDGTISHKEILNSVDEVNTWIWDKKYPTVKIYSDRTGISKVFTDNGQDQYEEIKGLTKQEKYKPIK